MYKDSAVPATPEIAPNIKYSVPISLWFVEKKKRVINWYTGLICVLVAIYISIAIFYQQFKSNNRKVG